ncbi:RNA-binding protein 44 isoform X2 [Macrotis lagotis]|uniref:RNA-binding protein 44 isoform X2 n=1 Tax=Macrotis lagotis TaxID=92651 RepID=UPI003D683362
MEVPSGPRGRGRRPTLGGGPEPGRRRRREAAAAAAERLLRARAPDEPSSPKRKHFFLASHYYDENGSGESLLTISHDHCNFLVLEQMDKDSMNLLDKEEMTGLSFSGSPPTSLGGAPHPSRELSGMVDYALLNDTYSINLSDSDSKLKEHFTYLNSEADLKMQKAEQFFDISKDQNKDSSVLTDICKNVDGDYKEIIGGGLQRHDLDEESQQEYHSFEEQDYSGYHLEFDQIKALCTPASEVMELGDSDYEIKCANGLGENHVKKLEGGAFFSYESTHIHTEDMVEAPKLHDYLSLTEYRGQKYWRRQEQEAGFMNQNLFDGIVQMRGAKEEPDLACSQASRLGSSPPKPLQTNLSPGKRKSQVPEKRAVCEEAAEEKKILEGLESASVVSWQPSQCFQNSVACIFDESDLSAYDQSCYRFIQSTTKPGLDFPMNGPKVLTKESHLMEEDNPSKAKGSIMNKTSLIEVESRSPPHSGDASRGCLVTVNQTIDASSDFRACFTTSRATSTRSSVTSRSSNTEITMMNKTRPNEWLNEKPRSIACNTDWSCLQDWTEEEGRFPGTLPKGPVENSKANENLLVKDYLELKDKFDVRNLKKSSGSLVPPSQECCQQVLQRAVRAELLLLKAHYQMCHQHCWKMYRLVVEEKESFTRNFASDFAKTELGSTLLSIFGDLKFKYLSLREKIIKGVPLDELPPLSVDCKLSPFFATFIPSKLIKEDAHILSGLSSNLDGTAAHNADPGTTTLKRALSQSMPTSESCHPKQDVAPKNESQKTQELNVGLRNLKLNDEEYEKCQEIKEAWFDAKENLTGIDCSEIPKRQTEQGKGSPEFTLEKKIAEPSQKEPSKSYLIHVGSLCPSVSETDLMSHFQKYQVSEVSICTSSHNYRNESQLALGGLEKTGDSKGSGSTPVPPKFLAPVSKPSGPEQENVYLSVDQKSGKKGFKQNKPVKFLPESPLPYIPPNTLNLGSFTKLLKKLEGLHPDISRNAIIDALQEVRANNKGFLSGLSLTAIVEMTNSILRNSAFKKEEERHREETARVGTY